MTLTVKRHPREFILVGDHPAIDFANTYAMPGGVWTDYFRTWDDVRDWLEVTGVSSEPVLQLQGRAAEAALAAVVELRGAWKEELAGLVEGGAVSEAWLTRLNAILAEEEFHEALRRRKPTGFQLERIPSQLVGRKLALALLARQIAGFLAEANLEYLRRCANTASCVLYFYDTTKNHRRQWCSTAVCGNRHKVAEFRARKARLRNAV